MLLSQIYRDQHQGYELRNTSCSPLCCTRIFTSISNSSAWFWLCDCPGNLNHCEREGFLLPSELLRGIFLHSSSSLSEVTGSDYGLLGNLGNMAFPQIWFVEHLHSIHTFGLHDAVCFSAVVLPGTATFISRSHDTHMDATNHCAQ